MLHQRVCPPHTIWLRELEVMENEYEEHTHSVMSK